MIDTFVTVHASSGFRGLSTEMLFVMHFFAISSKGTKYGTVCLCTLPTDVSSRDALHGDMQ